MTRLLLVASMVWLLGAAPASQPARKDPNAVTIENPAGAFRLTVPKNWKQQPQKTDRAVVLQLPSGGGTVSSSGGVFIALSTPTKGTLQQFVDARKTSLTEKSKETQFLTDEAVNLAGAEAWKLIYELPTETTETTLVNGKPAGKRQIKLQHRCLEYHTVRDGVAVQISYVCVAGDFDARVKAVQRVIDTIEWIAPGSAKAK